MISQIQLGADVELKDVNNRNVLHLVVMNGGRLEDFAATCKVKNAINIYDYLRTS